MNPIGTFLKKPQQPCALYYGKAERYVLNIASGTQLKTNNAAVMSAGKVLDNSIYTGKF